MAISIERLADQYHFQIKKRKNMSLIWPILYIFFWSFKCLSIEDINTSVHHCTVYSVNTVHIEGRVGVVQVHLRLSPDILQRVAGWEERHLQGPHVRHPCHPHLHPHQHSQVPGAEAGLRGGRD